MHSHRAPLLRAIPLAGALAPVAADGSSRLQSRITSSTWRLLGFVAFWAALAVWSVWLLGATGLVVWNPDRISVDLPWYGWLVPLAWATWLVGVVDHHWPRSQAAQPQPAGELTLPKAS
jgi:hypothetical protein